MLKLLHFASFFCIFMGGCKGIKPGDLTGIWLIKDASREVLPAELRVPSSRIVLNADGSFSAYDMPAVFHTPPDPPHLDSGGGQWKLLSRQNKLQVQLDFYTKSGAKLSNGPFTTQLNIIRSWSALKLSYFIGDPDEGQRIDLEKR
jgi:hypothetical protein